MYQQHKNLHNHEIHLVPAGTKIKPANAVRFVFSAETACSIYLLTFHISIMWLIKKTVFQMDGDLKQRDLGKNPFTCFLGK